MNLFDRKPKRPFRKPHNYLTNRKNKTEYTEERLAKDFNGKRVKGSGCTGEKGDIESEKYLIESKRTSLPIISLKLNYLEKIEEEAAAVGKKFLLISTFLNTISGFPRDYITISKLDFLELIRGKE